jgi:hypothetical protein
VAERRSAPLERHSALLAQHSVPLGRHSAQPEQQHSGPDCSCRAVRAAAAAYPRPRGVAVLLEWARLSAAVLRPVRRRARVSAQRVRQRPARVASAQRVRRRPVQVASAEQARQRAQPAVLAAQVLQRGAQAASAQQAAVPPEGRDAAAVRLPAADAVGAVLGVEAAPQPEARRALVARVRGAVVAAAVRAWPVLDARALPSAVLSVLAFRQDRLRSVLAPQPAVRFGPATTGLRIASL